MWHCGHFRGRPWRPAVSQYVHISDGFGRCQSRSGLEIKMNKISYAERPIIVEELAEQLGMMDMGLRNKYEPETIHERNLAPLLCLD
jgi:hypothetical protein